MIHFAIVRMGEGVALKKELCFGTQIGGFRNQRAVYLIDQPLRWYLAGNVTLFGSSGFLGNLGLWKGLGSLLWEAGRQFGQGLINWNFLWTTLYFIPILLSGV